MHKKFKSLPRKTNKNFIHESDTKESIFDKNSSNKIKIEIRKLNPHISHFNINSQFIYESKLSNYYYDTIGDYNLMKPNKTKIENLRILIKKLYETEERMKEQKTIKIDAVYAKLFEEMEKRPKILTYREKKIKDLISKENITTNISCRRLAEKYNSMNKDDHISKSTINRILCNKLNYTYRKTCIKTNFLLTKNSIRQCFFVIKIITRFLEMNGEIIFLDESAFYTKNNNFKTWRYSEETIYHKMNGMDKINLLLAVNSNKMIF